MRLYTKGSQSIGRIFAPLFCVKTVGKRNVDDDILGSEGREVWVVFCVVGKRVCFLVSLTLTRV